MASIHLYSCRQVSDVLRVLALANLVYDVRWLVRKTEEVKIQYEDDRFLAIHLVDL